MASTVSGEELDFSKQSNLSQPLMFSRTPSNMSESDVYSLIEDDRITCAGHTISFDNLTHVITKLSEPLGFQTVLDAISGRFVPGQFNAIIGVTRSGKSSLLRILHGIGRASFRERVCTYV